MAKLVNYAPEAWNHLHGVFCVYKPVDMSVRFMRNVIVGNLCRDLNELQPRHLPPIVAIEGEKSIERSVCLGEKIFYMSITKLNMRIILLLWWDIYGYQDELNINPFSTAPVFLSQGLYTALTHRPLCTPYPVIIIIFLSRCFHTYVKRYCVFIHKQLVNHFFTEIRTKSK